MKFTTTLLASTLFVSVFGGLVERCGENGAEICARQATTSRTTSRVTTTRRSTTKTTTTLRVTTTKTSAVSKTSKGTQTGTTRTLPASSGTTALPTARIIPAGGSFDGGMLRWERNPAVCQGQSETDEAAAMFILEDGATISNAIIGATQAEGIHCRGACTINNVWWADVCEDAATFKQPLGTQTSYVNGGGAFSAADKIFQFNGRGTVIVSNFYAQDYGKVIRTCGDCTNNGGPRHVVVRNVTAFNGQSLCGVNINYGDTCRIYDSCQSQGRDCDRYQGVVKGEGSSTKLGRGHDGIACFVEGFSGTC